MTAYEKRYLMEAKIDIADYIERRIKDLKEWRENYIADPETMGEYEKEQVRRNDALIKGLETAMEEMLK